MERQTNVTIDRNHRLLFYSSIFVYSRDLFSLFLSSFFFFEQIKSFSIPKRLSVVVFLFSFRLHFKLKPNS